MVEPTRVPWDQHYIQLANLIKMQGTCARRRVGCVLVNHRKQIVATGFNGVPPGWPHCSSLGEDAKPCPGVNAPSGQDLDLCCANHAEANALLQCRNVWEIDTCYVTTSPCVTCVKLLLCTSTRRIVFLEEYPQPLAKELWTRYVGVSRDLTRTRVADIWERNWVKYDGPEV